MEEHVACWDTAGAGREWCRGQTKANANADSLRKGQQGGIGPLRQGSSRIRWCRADADEPYGEFGCARMTTPEVSPTEENGQGGRSPLPVRIRIEFKRGAQPHCGAERSGTAARDRRAACGSPSAPWWQTCTCSGSALRCGCRSGGRYRAAACPIPCACR
jgi:hypothetical protein